MAQVQLILNEDIRNLGQAGEVVSVKPGFARNYLLPQQKAMLATESKVKQLEHHRRQIADKVEREQKAWERERERMEGTPLETTAQVGDEGKLFGSVTTQHVAEMLREKGFEVDRRRIELGGEGPIKQAGEHEVRVRLFRDIVAKVQLKVKAAE